MPYQKQITKTITLYTLEEMLADERLKEKFLRANAEDADFINNSLEQEADMIREDLERIGFSGVKIHWDLSGSQGSGCCFDFNGCNVFKLVRKYKTLLGYKNYYYLFKESNRYNRSSYTTSDIYTREIPELANHYTHYNTREIVFDFNPELVENADTSVFQNMFRLVYKDICYEIEKGLKKNLDYYLSEEFLIEDIKCRYPLALFNPDGTINQEYDSYTIKETQTTIDLEEFIKSKDSYVIIGKDGKIFADPNKTHEGDMYDLSDEPDLGFSKAILFNSIKDANDLIVDQFTDKEVITVEQAFKLEKEKTNE